MSVVVAKVVALVGGRIGGGNAELNPGSVAGEREEENGGATGCCSSGSVEEVKTAVSFMYRFKF